MLRSKLCSTWLLLLGATIGCSSATSEPAPAPQSRIVTGYGQRISVEVENQNYYEATIYAYRPGGRFRLGVVSTSRTEAFDFVWPDGDLRFLIDFLAVGCLLTESMPVVQGDELLLTIQPQDFRKASRAICTAARG